MNIASVFDWFAQESTYAAEHTEEPRQRDMCMRLSELWTAAAQRCRNNEASAPWPVAGSEDTELSVMMGPEVGH